MPQPPPRPPQSSPSGSGGIPAYIPPQVERAIVQQMQHALPPHLQQYAGAFVQQQHNMTPQMIRPATPHLQPHLPSSAHLPRPQFGQEPSVTPVATISQPGQASTLQPTTIYPDVQPAQPASPPPAPYDFITNPEPAPKRSPLDMIPGGNSILSRILLVGGGLVVLLVLFSFVKGLISGGSNLTSFVAVAQDQQSLIHIMKSVAVQPGAAQSLSHTNQNFAITAQLSLASAQSQVLTYLTTYKSKVSPQILNLKVSASIDQQLKTAVAAATYDQTFKEVTKTKLDTYSSDLKLAYSQAKGKKGRAMLQSDYDQAQLLLVQLDTPAN